VDTRKVLASSLESLLQQTGPHLWQAQKQKGGRFFTQGATRALIEADNSKTLQPFQQPDGIHGPDASR
jgi:hypothetical protein